MAMIKKAQKGLPVKKKAVVDSVESEMFPGKKIPKSKSNYANGEYAKMLGKKSVKENNPLKEMISNFSEAEIKKAKAAPKKKMKSGGMLKRADGSYSKRGLWDNIRANKGSGKKPTAAMLKQERKIKSKTKK